MRNLSKLVDIESWNRKSAYEFYKEYADPLFNITGNVKITKLLKHCKLTKESFFLHSLHCSLVVSNSIPEFRYRLSGEQLVEYDAVNVGSTFLKEDNSFGFCYFDYETNAKSFLVNGAKAIDSMKSASEMEPRIGEQNLIYHSVIPWVSFTCIKHARKGEGDQDSIPKIAFGKYFEQNDDWWIPVSVEGHHAIMDGFHVGLYFQKLEEMMGNGKNLTDDL